MKKLKPFFVVLLAAVILSALAACASNRQDSANPPPSQEPESASVQPSEPGTSADYETDTGSGGILVVYYSATGSTEAVAETIANTLDCDTFAITPVEAYTSDDLDWTNSNSRVSREHDDPSLRTVELAAATVENWDSYDTVFIGFPIWWGSAAWPMDSFVKANDFTGKTVIPFCTSASSDLGESGKLLAEMAGSGEWLEGRRFRSGASEVDVVEWVNGLNIQ